MSLVIAKIVDGRIRIESDSHLYNPPSQRQNPLDKKNHLDAILKVIIVSPRLTICFAGDVQNAHVAIGKIIRLVSERTIASREIAENVLKEHLRFNRSVDFILASTVSNILQIYRISDGTIASNLDSAWIGDPSGFELFQKHFHDQNTIQTASDSRERFAHAFDAVMNANQLNTVGSFKITISSDRENGIFKYLFSGISDVRIKVAEEDAGQQVFSDSASGGYTMVQVSTSRSDAPALAVFIYQIGAGLLFYPSCSLTAIRINHQSSISEFIDEIRRQYGIELQGMIPTVDNKNVVL